MDNAIIIAIITSAPAVVSAIIALATYISTKKGAALKKTIEPIKKQLHDIKLDTTRLQLIILLEHDANNIDTILKVAEYYFCVLNGDWYCTSLFKRWAKEHNVDIPDTIHQATKGDK